MGMALAILSLPFILWTVSTLLFGGGAGRLACLACIACGYVASLVVGVLYTGTTPGTGIFAQWASFPIIAWVLGIFVDCWWRSRSKKK